MNAAFCCASLGIVPTVRHADYIASWLEVLREDNRVHQEDVCQARGIMPTKKSQNEGGPSAVDIIGLLRTVSTD